MSFPASLTSIGWSAFQGCTGLTELTLPDSLTVIGSRAFRRCTGLTNLTLPDSLTSIGWSVFSYCRGLTELTLPDSLTSIGVAAFYGCTGLTELTLPDSLTSIGGSAFYGCTGLTELTLPDSLTSIEGRAFYGCTGLTELTLPASLTEIGGGYGIGAFYQCTGLTQVLFEGGAPALGREVFYRTASEFKVQFYEGASGFTTPRWRGYPSESLAPLTENAFTYRFIHSGEAAQIIGYTGSAADLIIPDTLRGKPVTAIGSSAFESNSTLQSVSFPASLTEIGESAFQGCSQLAQVLFEGDAPAVFGSSVFADTASGFRVVFYQGASGFTAPAWQDYILISLTYELIEEGQAVRITGSSGSAAEISIPSLAGGKPVKEIGVRAFESNSTLQSVSFPASLTSIGERAFYNCTGLTQLTLPASLTEIGSYAFSYCRGLTELTLPASLTSIGEGAFYECTGLTQVLFEGGAPAVFGSSVFYRTASGFRVQFYEGASGFTTPRWRGYPSESLTRSAFSVWRSRFGLGRSDRTARNGEPLLLAYALKLDPTDAAARLPVPVVEGGKIRLHFPVSADRSDVLLQVECTADLLSGAWETAGVETNSGMGAVSVPMTGAESPDKMYLRFTAQQAE